MPERFLDLPLKRALVRHLQLMTLAQLGYSKRLQASGRPGLVWPCQKFFFRERATAQPSSWHWQQASTLKTAAQRRKVAEAHVKRMSSWEKSQ